MALTSPDRPTNRADQSTSARADVELRLPGDGAYVSVLRTTAAGLGARLDLTLDEIEDLRMAVGEASAVVLPHAGPETDLTSRFWLDPTGLTVSISVDTARAAAADLDTSTFAWQVLATLATTLTSDLSDSRLTLTMRLTRSEPGRAH